MSQESTSSVDLLLGRIERVRSLAGRLVRDAAEADDLVQEAVVAALRRPVPVQGEGDGWIAAVLRNLTRDRARTRSRRGRREQLVSRREGDGSATDELVVNAERQRDLVEAVLALEDPYRETLLMRFFEDLAPREIVARTGRSPEAVKKHLQRGLGQLRSKLEARYGDRGAWAVALLPVAGREGLGAWRVGGGTLAGATLAKATPAALLALGAAAAWMLTVVALEEGAQDRSGPNVLLAERAVEGTTSVPPETKPQNLPIQGPTKAGARNQLEGVAVSDSASLPRDPNLVSNVRDGFRTVRILGVDGSALSDADVTLSFPSGTRPSQPLEAQTDEFGRMAPTGLPRHNLTSASWQVDGRTYAVAGMKTEATEQLYVLAPSVRLAGHVRDHLGNPIEGAQVTVWSEVDLLEGFPTELGSFQGHRPSRRTNAMGAFSFAWAPTAPAFLIHVVAEDYPLLHTQVPGTDEFGLELELGMRQPKQRQLEGTVLEATGAPAPGLVVHFGYQQTHSDANGQFRIEVPYQPGGEVLSVAAADGRFTVLPSPVDTAKVQASDIEGVVAKPVTLRLPETMGRLAGQLVDSAGDPMSDWSVFVFDGTRIGSSSRFHELGNRREELRTDAQGRFVIERAAQRPYRLRFLHLESLLVHDAGPFEPGPAERVVRLPEDAWALGLRGRVLDAHGQPAVNCKVELRVATKDPEGGGPIGMRLGYATQTDQEGRFEWERAPRRHATIVVDRGPGWSGFPAPLDEQDLDQTIELRVPLRCRVQLERVRPEITRIEFQDSVGKSVNAILHEAGMTTHTDRLANFEKRERTLFDISQMAETMVIYGTQGVLDRIPVRFAPGVINPLEL